MHSSPQAGYDVVVLAGGAGRRLGGLDKAGLEVGNRALLDRVLGACGGAGRIVVVGPRRDIGQPIRWTREDPAGGGPVAGLAAGLPLTSAAVVVVLAVDLPFLTAATVDRLAAAAAADGRSDGAILVDATGRDQPLIAAYRRRALVRRLRELTEPAGASISSLIRDLDLVRLPDLDAAGADCDTWAELERARARANSEGGPDEPAR
ncbi:MAG TPA: NTP transferase domain-containing protein [Actinomycetes bacterium]|nr:NTP transferase domain-containing protein [Actinomycetes bacterium]